MTEHRLGEAAGALESAEGAVDMCPTESNGADLAFALQVLGQLLVNENRGDRALLIRLVFTWRAGRKMRFHRSTFSMRMGNYLFVRDNPIGRASFFPNLFSFRTKSESGGWQ